LLNIFGAVRRLIRSSTIGQKFPELCFDLAKRFRRGKDLFHDGFATGARIAFEKVLSTIR
jgi:hypothetical protein